MAPKVPRLIDRELSWLEFNQRVLNEAADPEIRLLERLKFLAITASNLDEFVMVRVGGLKWLAAEEGAQGGSATAQLGAVSLRAHEMVAAQYEILRRDLQPGLADAGIRQVAPAQLGEAQQAYAAQFFEQSVLPVLTPMAIDRQRRFPPLRNLGLHLGVRLRPEPGKRSHRFAVVPIGVGLERFVGLPAAAGREYLLIEDLVSMFVDRLFHGESVVECVPFRITRNADLEVREDLAADLLAEMEAILDARTRSHCIRLEIDAAASATMRTFLRQAQGVGETDVYAVAGPLDLSAFMSVATTNGYEELKNEPWPPHLPPEVDPAVDMFTNLSRRDVLLVHPFDSFDPVQRLIDEAADDPDVLAIKQILYRTSRDSPIVAALMRAAANGKYVTAIVELKARFDEARNIGWAKTMERAGVETIYGIRGLKTHAKLCVIVRREAQGLKRYMHFGTGNYNEATARLYTDVSYMTSDDDFAADASAFLNTITGYSQPRRFHHIEAAPVGLRDRILELIAGEAERKKQGQKALIMAKVNSLADERIIEALYAASAAGVPVQLNVRGICRLRPGVPGLSDNISVVSIVDRYLEHSRVMYFHHGGEKRVWISSADWMSRNLDRRIELLVPVVDDDCRDRLIHVLETMFQDTIKGSWLQADGSYERRKPVGRRRALRSQEYLYRDAGARAEAAQRTRPTVFEPHRPPTADAKAGS